MKKLFRTIFSPILNVFERGDELYAYKPLNRKILIVIGILFSGLASLVVYLSKGDEDVGYLLPVFVFSAIALVTLVVGFLGSERAVAKIWGNR